MNSSIFINSKGFVEIKNINIVTPEDAMECGREYINFATKLGDEGKKTNMLLDSSNVEDWGEGTFPLVLIIFQKIDFHKMATFGANEKISQLQREIIVNAKIENKAKVFKTREEAEDWLEKE